MNTPSHDGFDEGSDIFILDSSFSSHLMETSSIGTIPIISKDKMVYYTVKIPPEDHILLLDHK